MKKIFFLMLANIAICISSFAQTNITLLHTIENNLSLALNHVDYDNSFNNKQYLNGKYYSNSYYYDYSQQEIFRQGRWYRTKLEGNTYTIEFWDENFQPAGTKTFRLPNIENYKLYDFKLHPNTPYYYYSTKFFNDDEAAEYLLQYELTDEYKSGKSSEEYVNKQYKLILVKEDGTILYDFGESRSRIDPPYHLYYLDNKWIFTLEKQIWVDGTYNYYTEVYQIHKQAPTGLQQVSSPQHIPAYPNPAFSEINIPMQDAHGMNSVRIYDMNGRLIETRNGEGEVINVNVSGYPAGNYIYQTNENSGKFIKQ